MAHHAYVLEGTKEAVVAKAQSAALRLLAGSTDLQILTYEQLSIEQARALRSIAYQDSTEGARVIIIYTSRIFHEAQNALLKIFEEPPTGTTLILGVPSLGLLLPTLRSRLVLLQEDMEGTHYTDHAFRKHTGISTETASLSLLDMSAAEREKFLAKLLERTKADTDSVKQAARAEATEVISSTIIATHALLTTEKDHEVRKELRMLLEELTEFLAMTHERSAPLKLIFEHIQLVIPK